jgi:hypothetical protein
MIQNITRRLGTGTIVSNDVSDAPDVRSGN